MTWAESRGSCKDEKKAIFKTTLSMESGSAACCQAPSPPALGLHIEEDEKAAGLEKGWNPGTVGSAPTPPGRRIQTLRLKSTRGTFADETKCSSVVITCISVKVLVAAQFVQQLQE